MERIRIQGQRDQFGKIEVLGLSQFTRELKKAQAAGIGDKMMKKANERVAALVIERAQAIASGKMQKKAAGSLTVASSSNSVKVVGGGKDVPYFGGANFGAQRNQRRLIKKGNMRGTRSRATKVRDGEDVSQVVKRVEQQYVTKSGKTTTKYEGGLQVRLSRDANGNVKVIRGWNQFPEWQKGRDQFLYRAVTQLQDKIVKMYNGFIDDISRGGFPN